MRKFKIINRQKHAFYNAINTYDPANDYEAQRQAFALAQAQEKTTSTSQTTLLLGLLSLGGVFAFAYFAIK